MLLFSIADTFTWGDSVIANAAARLGEKALGEPNAEHIRKSNRRRENTQPRQ